MRRSSFWLALAVVPLLAACVNDGATYSVDGSREHTLSVMREQPLLWDNKVNLSFVVSRMPACMRRHDMGGGTRATKVEIYQVPSGAFIVKAGKRLWATETQNCVNFVKMDGEPDTGMGKFVGTFREKDDRFDFEPAEADAAK